MIFGFLIIDNILMQNFLPQRHAAPEVHYVLEGKIACIFGNRQCFAHRRHCDSDRCKRNTFVKNTVSRKILSHCYVMGT